MFTLVGYMEDIDPAGIWVPITGLVDQHINVVGDEITVPELNNIVALMAGVENTAAPEARLVSPTLRRASMFNIAPLNVAAAGPVNVQTPPVVLDLRRTPVKLRTDEALECQINSNPAAAQDQWCMVWLADGPIRPVEGDIFTVHAESATAAVANVWTNVPIVLEEDLAPGRYQCVGMSGMSAGMVAARLVPRGGRWRPGCAGRILAQNLDSEMFRYGRFGAFCEFTHNVIPSVDVMSTLADAAQGFYLDLIQIG